MKGEVTMDDERPNATDVAMPAEEPSAWDAAEAGTYDEMVETAASTIKAEAGTIAAKWERGSFKTRDIFLKAVASGLSISRACKIAKVNRTVPYYWRERDDEFRQAWADAEAEGLDQIEDRIRAAANLDWRAGVRILESRRPDVWSQRRLDGTIKHTGEIGHKVSGEVAVGLSAPLASWLEEIAGGIDGGEGSGVSGEAALPVPE
jgi:hypothetical protein